MAIPKKQVGGWRMLGYDEGNSHTLSAYHCVNCKKKLYYDEDWWMKLEDHREMLCGNCALLLGIVW